MYVARFVKVTPILNGLWGVVAAIIGDKVDEEGIDVKEILYASDPKLVEEN